MSLTTAPANIAPGSPVSMLTPTNQPWAQVVISNLSGYLLQVQAAGAVSWLNPYTENIYSTGETHSPIVLAAQLPAGTTIPAGSSEQVQGTWYGPSEQPQGTWPVSLTAQAVAAAVAGIVAIGTGVEQVFDGFNNFSVNNPLVESFVATQNLQGLQIDLGIASAAGPWVQTFRVSVVNVTKGTPALNYVQTARQGAGGPDFNPIGPVSVPVSANAGDTVSVTITFLAGTSNLTTSINITGVGLLPPTDGPNGPSAVYNVGGLLKTQAAWGAFGVLTPVLAAPPSGACYRLHSAWNDVDTQTGYIVDSGASVVGFLKGALGNGVAPGQLCLGAITIKGATNPTVGGSCYLTYDLVTQPLIV